MSSRKDRRRSTSMYYYNKNHDKGDNYQNTNSSKHHHRRSEINPEEKRSFSPCVEPERKDDRKEISAQSIKWEKNRPNDIPSTSSRSSSKKLPIRADKDADSKKQTQVAVTNPSKGQNSPKVNPILEKDTKHDRENWAKSPAMPIEPVVVIENSGQFDDSSQESSISGTLNESQFELSPIECPEIQSIKIPAPIEFQNQAELEMNDSRHFRKWAKNRAREEHDKNDDAILHREAKVEPLEDKVDLHSSSDLPKEREVVKKNSTIVLEAVYTFGEELNQMQDEYRRNEREIKNLKQKMERFEESWSPSRSSRSLCSRRERSVQSCERGRSSLRHSSSSESSQSQDSSHSHERREQFEPSKSLNRSCGSQYSRKETSVSKRTSTDRTGERRTRSQGPSSSRARRRSRSGSNSRKRDLGHQHQPTRNRWRSRTPGRQAPPPPTDWNRRRIRSDKAATNTKSRHQETLGIVAKKQNRYESKARLDPGELIAEPTVIPSKKPNQNKPPECADLEKFEFPYEEYEFIGDSLSFYLANIVSKVTEDVSKPYLKEQINLTGLYQSIKPVTFAKSKAIVSMAQHELNFSRLENRYVREMVEEVIDLLIEKGFEIIIVLFPLIKPVTGNQKPVSMSQYFAYRQIFESVCYQRQIPFWWTPSAVFLQHNDDENHPGELKFDQDEDGNMIPIKCKFNRRKISGKLKFYPELHQKNNEVLVEIDKLYNRQPMQTLLAAPKTKKNVEITKKNSHEIVTGSDGKRYLVCKEITCRITTTELPEMCTALPVEQSASDVPDIQLSPKWYQKTETNVLGDAKSVRNAASLVADSSTSAAGSETVKMNSSSQSFAG